jgi:hypothetical protein
MDLVVALKGRRVSQRSRLLPDSLDFFVSDPRKQPANECGTPAMATFFVNPFAGLRKLFLPFTLLPPPPSYPDSIHTFDLMKHPVKGCFL